VPLLSLYQKCKEFDILKKCGEELKITVHFMDVNDVDVEME